MNANPFVARDTNGGFNGNFNGMRGGYAQRDTMYGNGGFQPGNFNPGGNFPGGPGNFNQGGYKKRPFFSTPMSSL